MPTPIIILFILSIVTAIMVPILDNTKLSKYSYLSKIIYSLFLIALSLVGFLISYQGLSTNHIVYGILMTTAVSLYAIKNITILLINKYKGIDENKLRFIEIYSSMAFYILSTIVMIIYLSFNFVSLIIACFLAIIFYSSIYLLKRNETKKNVLMFFIYALIISLFVSVPLTALFSLEDGSARIHISAFLTSGVALIYLSSIFRYGDAIFNTYPKNIKLSNAITTLIYMIGLIFMSLSITYIFIWS